MSKNDITFLSNASVTGSARQWERGRGLWTVWGAWDGATAVLQFSPDDGVTWIDFEGVSLSSDGGFNDLILPKNGVIRVKITNSGASTSLTSKMHLTA